MQQNKTTFSNPLPKMDRTEFKSINWQPSDYVRLTNGKAYRVESYDPKKLQFILYSKEYKKKFRADKNIVSQKVEIKIKNKRNNRKKSS